MSWKKQRDVQANQADHRLPECHVAREMLEEAIPVYKAGLEELVALGKGLPCGTESDQVGAEEGEEVHRLQEAKQIVEQVNSVFAVLFPDKDTGIGGGVEGDTDEERIFAIREGESEDCVEIREQILPKRKSKEQEKRQ